MLILRDWLEFNQGEIEIRSNFEGQYDRNCIHWKSKDWIENGANVEGLIWFLSGVKSKRKPWLRMNLT
jgi:hypothetical protein